MKTPYTESDIFKLIATHQMFDLERIVATYADERNWIKVYNEQGCHWCWKGPVMVGFELAQWGIHGIALDGGKGGV